MAKYVKQAYTGIDFYNSYMEFVKGNPLYEIEYHNRRVAYAGETVRMKF